MGALMGIFDDTRSDWDARPPNGTLRTVPWDQRIGVSWHWIGPGRGVPATSSHALCLELVNKWQLQHQTRVNDPWKDIGYNGLVCQHARAIEGRGLQYQGSHSPGVNWEHVGLQFMVGDLTPAPAPSPAMYARAVVLRAEIGRLGPNIRRDWTHRDDPEASTTCAGNVIQKWVDAGGPTTEGDDDMPVSPEEIKAIATAAGTEVWTRPVYRADGSKITTGAALGEAMRDSAEAVRLLKTYTDPAALADAIASAVVAKLPAADATDKETVKKALREFFGELADTPEVPA